MQDFISVTKPNLSRSVDIAIHASKKITFNETNLILVFELHITTDLLHAYLFQLSTLYLIHHFLEELFQNLVDSFPAVLFGISRSSITLNIVSSVK